MQITQITARDIPDAWFQLVYKILERGFDYTIQHGSYVGAKRLEFDYIVAHIKFPQTRPMEPKIPAHYGIPDPVKPGYIEEYTPYLMTDKKAENEDYTYGERITRMGRGLRGTLTMTVV